MAKCAYLGMLIGLGGVILASLSLFAAASNVALMVGLISLAHLATGAYAAAVVELDNCTAEPCGGWLGPLRQDLLILLSIMGTLTVLLLALALVAAIPFAGAAAAGSVLAFCVGFIVGASAVVEAGFAVSADNFNNCRITAGLNALWPVVTYLALAAACAAITVSTAGFVTGTFPVVFTKPPPPTPPWVR